MALTIATPTDLPYYIDGHQKRINRELTFDSSYPTGGEALTAADLGMNRIDDSTCTFQQTGTNAGGTGTGAVHAVRYDGSNVLVYDGDSEVADTTNLSDLVVKLTAWGY